MPVSRIATRSARAFVYAARFGNTPGYSTGSSVASSGCCTPAANRLSADGGSEFHSSLNPIPTSTSLNSGLPRRETSIHSPAWCSLHQLPSCTRAAWRLADAHTPITDPDEVGAVGLDP